MSDIINEDLDIICCSGLDWNRFKNCTVLISGAYGMLPSYMLFTLLHLNEMYRGMNIKIIALCRNYDKARIKFGASMDNPFLTILCHDVNNEIKIAGPIDYIIHAASYASSAFYEVDPVGVISPNVFGNRNLLELGREKNVKGFLFFSSGEVCGAIDKDSITEQDAGYLDPTDVRNCYGESKRMGENMCKCWYHQYQVPTYVVRPDHTYGPTMDLENDHRVFAEFVSDVVNNKNIVIKSDGQPVRTFCYISDATDGFFRVLLNGTPGESYHISNNEGRISIADLANLIVSLFPEKRLNVIYDKRKDSEHYLENKHTLRPMLSTAKIEKLGYKCLFNLRDGFHRTISHFMKENKAAC
jgi:nucleoside-diphosphate-sugar epimerase